MLRLTRYARVTVTARSRSTCGATARTPAGSWRSSATPKRLDVAAGSQAQIDAIQAAELLERPLRRGNVHDSQRLRISTLGENAGDVQRLRRAADDDLQRITALQMQLLGSAIAQENGIRLEQIEDAAAMSPMRDGCSAAARNGSSPSTLSVSRRPGRATSSSRTGLATLTAGSRASFGEQLLGEALARPADHDVGLAHQALRCPGRTR